MPSRKRKTTTRKKRKVVGARDASSGQFVEIEKLETEPDTTVAVTKPVEEVPASDKPTDEDDEC
jgi:hypothetical protein